VQLARNALPLLRDGTRGCIARICRDRRVGSRVTGIHVRTVAQVASFGMDVARVEEGLWRWTAPHPDWKQGADWEQQVGCVYWESDDAVVLIDPLVPGEPADREHFLGSLDADVVRAGRAVAVLLTCEWHARSAGELAARYDAPVVEPFSNTGLPGGIRAVEARVAEEVVYWLPGPRAIVPGDTLIGSADSVTLCPESWLGGRGGLAQLRSELAPLLDLPVERVLTSHGAPVLAGGLAALAQALAPA
jgi:glyoxylase-like metal-dependent hydrolase (beta-lactamase superfamily II)